MLIGQRHCHKCFLNYPIGQLSDFLLPPHSRQVPSLLQDQKGKSDDIRHILQSESSICEGAFPTS